jgi:hypothetical protein
MIQITLDRNTVVVTQLGTLAPNKVIRIRCHTRDGAIDLSNYLEMYGVDVTYEETR